MLEDQEQHILILVHEGKLQAGFNALVDGYSKRLYWHIRKIVLNHEDADDVLQNTFIKIWKALPKFRGESKLYTWLYRIATNEALSFLRSNKKTESNTEQLQWLAKADAHFDGTEAQEILWEAIATLPDKQRAVFNLKYFEEIKYEEMSVILNTSVGALKASYHHATQKIKQYISTKDFY